MWVAYTHFPALGARFASSSDWLIWLFAFAVIGSSYYFSFSFTTLSWKPLYLAHVQEIA